MLANDLHEAWCNFFPLNKDLVGKLPRKLGTARKKKKALRSVTKAKIELVGDDKIAILGDRKYRVTTIIKRIGPHNYELDGPWVRIKEGADE